MNSDFTAIKHKELMNDIFSEKKERRKSMRRFAALNIKCFLKNAEIPIDALLVNISRGGMAIECKENITIGDKITIILKTPDGKKIPVYVEILHSSRGNFGHLYGAKYAETKGEVFDLLSNFLLKYFNLY